MLKLRHEIMFHPSSEFYWLPIQARIEYKLSIFVTPFFSETAHAYLYGFPHVHSIKTDPPLFWLSNYTHTPHVQTKTSGHRSFPHAAPFFLEFPAVMLN